MSVAVPVRSSSAVIFTKGKGLSVWLSITLPFTVNCWANAALYVIDSRRKIKAVFFIKGSSIKTDTHLLVNGCFKGSI